MAILSSCVIPNGIRPAYWFQDDEIVVGASERPAIQSVFQCPIQGHERAQARPCLNCKVQWES
jgi:hypothetical protein